MKLLVISQHSPEISTGGIERHIANFINFSKNQSVKVIFLLPADGQEGQEVSGNVVIYRQRFLNVPYRIEFGKKRVFEKELKDRSEEFFLFLLDLFDKEKIDIVSAQDFQNTLPIYSLVLNMACFSRKVPLVLRVHSYARTGIQKEIMNSLFWKKIICISKSVAGDCFSKEADIHKIVTKYLGIDVEKFKPNLDKSWLRNQIKIARGQKIILHASRLITGHKDILQEKGIITLLEAFSKLARDRQGLKLLIAMARPPARLKEEFAAAREKLMGYIKLHNLEGRVVCKRFDLEEMPLVYNGSDIFVLASKSETFGQVYAEAMACGIPVIGTNVGGVPEIIIDNYNGFLIPRGNSSILAQKIEQLLDDEKLRKSFIEAGLKTVRNSLAAKKQFNILLRYLNKLSNSF